MLFERVDGFLADFDECAGVAAVDDDFVEDAVDEVAALVGAVGFGQLDVFVEGHVDGDGREVGELGHGHRDDECVHEGETVDVPVLDVSVQFLTAGFVLCNGELKQFVREELVVLINEEWEERTLCGVGRFERTEGAVDET